MFAPSAGDALGTWDLAIVAPERFAAIVPVARGGDADRADQLVNSPTWAFHGDHDRTVPLKQTTKMIDAVKSAGGLPRLSLL
jgi:predicted peptidase